jgi:uncharacterized protein YbjT (DUF2867 family)
VDVFVTGGTGYIGQRLTRTLVQRRHHVRVLTRPESANRIVAGATAVVGNALDASSFRGALTAADTVVHLVGTPHPSPAKALDFQRVDLPSIQASVAAASAVQVAHFVYVSVAHPAPVMKAYIEVRVAGEAAIARGGLTATVLRPWYVMGPGHRWPLMLKPLYAALEVWPGTRERAQRLGLVTIGQMVQALVQAVEQPPPAGTIRIMGVPEIRAVRARKGHPT